VPIRWYSTGTECQGLGQGIKHSDNEVSKLPTVMGTPHTIPSTSIGKVETVVVCTNIHDQRDCVPETRGTLTLEAAPKVPNHQNDNPEQGSGQLFTPLDGFCDEVMLLLPNHISNSSSLLTLKLESNPTS
jgi:hypothetical protein